MRRNDIRFNGQAATIQHASARGRITRNADNFTRGSQLLSHQYQMTWAGIKIPLWIWVGVAVVVFNIFIWLGLKEHEFQLDLMRCYSTLWTWVGGDKYHLINLTLPGGKMVHLPMGYVPYHPAVVEAWEKTWRIVWATFVIASIVAAPVIMWFITWANKRGSDILKERHERGAMLVERPVLVREIKAHNQDQFSQECRSGTPQRNPAMVAQPRRSTCVCPSSSGKKRCSPARTIGSTVWSPTSPRPRRLRPSAGSSPRSSAAREPSLPLYRQKRSSTVSTPRPATRN